MKTILVPVDFSATSFNAAKYAVMLSQQIKADKVVLFHTYGGSYQILDQGAEVIVETNRVLIENMKTELASVSQELSKTAPSSLIIETEITDGFFIEDTLELVEKHQADMVVMGITGKNTLEQKLIGSNTYRLATESPVPVLIVPSRAQYQVINNIALSLQFKQGVMNHTPYQSINGLVSALNANLTILNVANDVDNEIAAVVKEGVSASHEMFDGLNAEMVYLGDATDVVVALTEYVEQNDIQMLISISHKMGFLRSLFKGSVTKQLAFYTTIPLLVYKAID